MVKFFFEDMFNIFEMIGISIFVASVLKGSWILLLVSIVMFLVSAFVHATKNPL